VKTRLTNPDAGVAVLNVTSIHWASRRSEDSRLSPTMLTKRAMSVATIQGAGFVLKASHA